MVRRRRFCHRDSTSQLVEFQLFGRCRFCSGQNRTGQKQLACHIASLVDMPASQARAPSGLTKNYTLKASRVLTLLLKQKLSGKPKQDWGFTEQENKGYEK
jgi:hypothetical protein